MSLSTNYVTDDTEEKHITNNIGAALIKDVNIEIGGQEIDKHYNHWLSCYFDLNSKNDLGRYGNPPDLGGAHAIENKDDTYNHELIHGNDDKVTIMNGYINTSPTLEQKTSGMGIGASYNPPDIYYDSGERHSDQVVHSIPAFKVEQYSKSKLNFNIPLRFWFCKNPGLALPIIALNNTEIKININFEKQDICYNNIGTTLLTSGCTVKNTTQTVSAYSNKLMSDYIHLDEDERRRFINIPHEYLIDQVQYNRSQLTLRPQRENDLSGTPYPYCR